MCILSSFNSYRYVCYCLIALVLLTINRTAYGQVRTGLVTTDQKPLSGAVIRNLTLQKFAQSGRDGAFMISMRKGDTIITNYVGLKTDTAIYNDQNPLLIALKPLPNTLKEVNIKDKRLSPLDNLRKNQSDYKQIYRIGDDSHLINLVGGYGFAGIAISIDALYSHFSREGKNARKLQKTLVRDYYDDIIDTRFSKSLVTKYTGYQGKQLDDFMIDNRPDYQFIKYASDYDVIKYIQKRSGKNLVTKDSVVVAGK